MGGFSTSPDITGLAVEATLDAVALLLADAEQDTDLLLSRLTAAAALGTDLATANAGIVTTTGRLSAGRAGYLDNLSGGAVALQTDLATVLSRLSAARAGYFDNLSAGAVATAAALATAQGNITTLVARITAAVALASDLATAQGNITTLLARIPGTVLQSVKNIQRGSIAFVSSELSATATITAVDMSKSMLFALGWESTHVTSFWRVALTNTTTITATRATPSATTAAVGFQIVEFN